MSHGDYFARLIENGKSAIFPYFTKLEDPMPDYQPERAIPTQVAHPWQASLRTIFAVAVSVILVACAAWSLYTGAGVESNLEILIGSFILVAGGITRVMAHPAVNAALEYIGLGANPTGENNEA